MGNWCASPNTPTPLPLANASVSMRCRMLPSPASTNVSSSIGCVRSFTSVSTRHASRRAGGRRERLIAAVDADEGSIAREVHHEVAVPDGDLALLLREARVRHAELVGDRGDGGQLVAGRVHAEQPSVALQKSAAGA